MNEKWHDRLKGGLADKKDPSDFDKTQLKAGIKVEMEEHTDDRGKAAEIAMDHLSEDPNYYKKLAKMENEAVNTSAHKIKKGDEIQAAGAGGKEQWKIGAFISYEDGMLTLDNAVPLYNAGGGINTKEYIGKQPTAKFKPASVFVYDHNKPDPVLTWNAHSDDDLSRFIESSTPKMTEIFNKVKR